jgi:hypothetical protein
MRVISILVLILLTTTVYGQSSKKKNKRSAKATEQSSPAPNTLDPNAEERYVPKKAKKKPSKGATYESEQEYYDRMAALEKTRRKNERMLDKPQYSDPSYFGHKRPPKKRPPGKMKYCKVCGLRH